MPELSAGHLEEQIRESVGTYAAGPDLARQALAQLLMANPPAFRRAVLPALRAGVPPGCRQFLIDMMLESGLLPLAEPTIFPLDEELAIAREVALRDRMLDLKLARRLSPIVEPVPDEVALRLLDLLAVVSKDNRILPLVVRLLSDPNPRLRSKTALLIAHSNMSPQTNTRLLSERDPRVRANAIEALWGSTTATSRILYREATRDGNNRVVGNALLGLYLLGDTSSIPQILKMAAHPDPLFRATASWVMQQTGNPRFIPVLQQLVRESRPGARNRVFQAITVLKRAAARFAASPELRLHVLSAKNKSDGSRTLHAAVATGAGAAVTDLSPTSVVVSEDGQQVAHYSVGCLPAPERIALGLYLPEGAFGERVAAALEPFRQARDRRPPVLYRKPSAQQLMRLFGSLGLIGPNHHVFVHSGESRTREFEDEEFVQIAHEALLTGTKIHCVSLRSEAPSCGLRLAERTGGYTAVVEDLDQAVAAYEKFYLGLQLTYEITYRTSAGAAPPEEIKLEIFGPAGHGCDVFRTQPASR